MIWEKFRPAVKIPVRRDPKTLASPAENIAVFIKEMVTRQDGRKLKQSKPGLPKRFKVAYAH